RWPPLLVRRPGCNVPVQLRDEDLAVTNLPRVTCGAGSDDGLNGPFNHPVIDRNFQPKLGPLYTELRAPIDPYTPWSLPVTQHFADRYQAGRLLGQGCLHRCQFLRLDGGNDQFHGFSLSPTTWSGDDLLHTPAQLEDILLSKGRFERLTSFDS